MSPSSVSDIDTHVVTVVVTVAVTVNVVTVIIVVTVVASAPVFSLVVGRRLVKCGVCGGVSLMKR